MCSTSSLGALLTVLWHQALLYCFNCVKACKMLISFSNTHWNKQHINISIKQVNKQDWILSSV